MVRGIRRQGPALVVAIVALLIALGGSVYAAAKPGAYLFPAS